MSKTIAVVLSDSQKLIAVEARNGYNALEVLRFTDCQLPASGLTSGWLREIWRKHHFSSNRIICLIPPELVKFKSRYFPELAEEQLEAALRLEHESKNQLFKVIGVNRNEQGVEVKTAVIDDAQLQNYLTSFEAAGLQVLWSGLRFRGLHAFLNFHGDYFEDEKTCLYLDLNETMAELGLVNESELLYRRNIPFSPDSFRKEISGTDDDFLEELRLSLAAATKQNGDLPERIWLFGDLRQKTFPFERIADALKTEVYLPAKSRFSGTLTGVHTPQLAALLGLALDELGWDPQLKLRFRTKNQVRQATVRHRLAVLIKIGVMILFVMGGLLFGIKAQSVREARDKVWIEHHVQELDRLKQLKLETRNNLETIRSLEAWLDGRGAELEFLRILQENLPEETVIEDLMIEDGKLKNLSGFTPSVSLLLHRFQQVPELKGLKLKGSITAAKDGREQFQMEGTTNLKESVP